MQNWKDSFSDKDIFFVTPDVKRGIGFDGILPRYHIVCLYKEPLVDILRRQGANIFCLEELEEVAQTQFNNTGKLLTHPLVRGYIAEHSKNTPWILYFKPSPKIDLIIRNKKYNALGNSYLTGKPFEDKIEFYRRSQSVIGKNGVPAIIGKLDDFQFGELATAFSVPFVVQFGFGWAGKSTFFIYSEKEYIQLAKKYQYSLAKMSKKIEGFTVLNNCCIHNGKTVISSPAIQINVSDIFEKEAVTCGRQWPIQFLEKNQVKMVSILSQKIGELLMEEGYKGFFGIDFLVDSKNGEIFVSEVNARLTASSAFYTRLERNTKNIPLMAYHIGEFMGMQFEHTQTDDQEISGSQIILRSAVKTPIVTTAEYYGVYNISQSMVPVIKNEYNPEKLAQHEFIYIKSTREEVSVENAELARIETLEKVLDDARTLKKPILKWLKSGN